MRRIIVLVTAFIVLLPAASAGALGSYPAGSTGYDVSWPNCNVTPPQRATFGIVGVNDGKVFTGNPCLYEESTWFQNLSLYLNTAYPGANIAQKYQYGRPACAAHNESCVAYNFGWDAARYSLTYASLQNVHTMWWWLDVETANSWTTDIPANTESLQGMIDALRQYTFLPTIGFYAYHGQWQTLTYGWQNNLPAWAATGSLDRADALAACKHTAFSGTKPMLTQYTEGLDRDYVC